MTDPRWSQRPSGSNWGDFGPDDTLGRLNLLGPEQVLNGIAEVREGRVFALSLPLELPGGTALNPNRMPPVVRPNLRAGHANFNLEMAVAYPGAPDLVSDDLVVLHTQYSTQWDAFGHVGAFFDADGDGIAEKRYYNGWRAGADTIGPDDPQQAGVGSLADLDGVEAGRASTSDTGPVGVASMAEHGVQGRAVLVDLAAHLGDVPTLVGYDVLADVMAADGVVVEPGDLLVIHTGFARKIIDASRPGSGPGPAEECAVLDGADAALHSWIEQSGVAAIAADNYAVEAFPSPSAAAGGPLLPLHELCLFRLGIHLGELWWLSDLADHLRAQGRHRFLLTAPPLRLPGTTGSPLTPIATV